MSRKSNIQFVDLVPQENIEEFDQQLNRLKRKLGSITNIQTWVDESNHDFYFTVIVFY